MLNYQQYYQPTQRWNWFGEKVAKYCSNVSVFLWTLDLGKGISCWLDVIPMKMVATNKFTQFWTLYCERLPSWFGEKDCMLKMVDQHLVEHVTSTTRDHGCKSQIQVFSPVDTNQINCHSFEYASWCVQLTVRSGGTNTLRHHTNPNLHLQEHNVDVANNKYTNTKTVVNHR